MSAPSLLFPPRLAIGDVIGLCAPASPPEQPEVVDQVIERLTAFGFKIKPSRFLRERRSYLAGSDEERAADLNGFFADPEVKGIFCLRGGYGSCRILPLLDYDLIRANPKALVGYSDITAMHVAIWVKTGLVTFHGSNATSMFEPGNEIGCRKALMDPLDPKGTVFFEKGDANSAKIKTVIPGRVSGPFFGGNMTCLLRLLATPYQPNFRGAILFLEDTGEKAYRVDGLFAHLRLAGILPQLGGLILGQFDHPDEKEQERVNACLHREAERIGVPCITGAPIGHFAEQVMVPQGVSADFDAETGRLTFHL